MTLYNVFIKFTVLFIEILFENRKLSNIVHDYIFSLLIIFLVLSIFCSIFVYQAQNHQDFVAAPLLHMSR